MQSSDNLQESVIHSSWSHFAALEQELEDSKAFIDIHKDNYHLTSDKYQSIIMQACAEIENIYQQICGKTLEVTHNISAHIQSITEHCKNFFSTEILMPMHSEVIKPWNACAEGKDPAFWTMYHAIKHENALEVPTLEHAIHSLAGLFSLLLALD